VVGRTSFDFGGRVVIVTGASKGIGRAIAHAFAAAGASVVVSSRDQARCDAVVEEILSGGGSAHAVAAHAGRTDALDALLAATIDRFGRVDVVVNNAATNPVVAPLFDYTDELVEKVFAVNAFGPLHLARAAAAWMAEHGGGSVLNIVSKAAMAPEPNLGVYAASKAALVTLTKAMALEWAALGVRVNAIAPGPFATVMVKDLFADPVYGPALVASTAQKRIAEPEEIVGAALFLSSEDASFVTGSVLAVDGGMVP
jgi:NAD(P)-dependent dehydrogenase (short-subunit alcohol dehydrogenase family)